MPELEYYCNQISGVRRNITLSLCGDEDPLETCNVRFGTLALCPEIDNKELQVVVYLRSPNRIVTKLQSHLQ